MTVAENAAMTREPGATLMNEPGKSFGGHGHPRFFEVGAKMVGRLGFREFNCEFLKVVAHDMRVAAVGMHPELGLAEPQVVGQQTPEQWKVPIQ